MLKSTIKIVLEVCRFKGIKTGWFSYVLFNIVPNVCGSGYKAIIIYWFMNSTCHSQIISGCCPSLSIVDLSYCLCWQPIAQLETQHCSLHHAFTVRLVCQTMIEIDLDLWHLWPIFKVLSESWSLQWHMYTKYPMTKLMKNYQLFTCWWFKSLYPALTNMLPIMSLL